jgi:hypothetical protein
MFNCRGRYAVAAFILDHNEKGNPHVASLGVFSGLSYFLLGAIPATAIAKWWIDRSERHSAECAGSGLSTKVCGNICDPPRQTVCATLKIVNWRTQPLQIQSTCLKGWMFQGAIKEMLIEDPSCPFQRCFPADTSVGPGDAISITFLIRATPIHRILIRRSRIRMKVVTEIVDAQRYRRTLIFRSNIINWCY